MDHIVCLYIVCCVVTYGSYCTLCVMVHIVPCMSPMVYIVPCVGSVAHIAPYVVTYSSYCILYVTYGSYCILFVLYGSYCTLCVTYGPYCTMWVTHGSYCTYGVTQDSYNSSCVKQSSHYIHMYNYIKSSLYSKIQNVREIFHSSSPYFSTQTPFITAILIWFLMIVIRITISNGGKFDNPDYNQHHLSV